MNHPPHTRGQPIGNGGLEALAQELLLEIGVVGNGPLHAPSMASITLSMWLSVASSEMLPIMEWGEGRDSWRMRICPE